jgi:hypothetical protein
LLGVRVRVPFKARTFVSRVCRVLCRQRPLRRADNSSREFLPAVCVLLC